MTIFFSDLLYRGIPVNSEEWVFGSYVEHRTDNDLDDMEARKYFIAPDEPYTLMQMNGDTWVHKVIEIRRDTLGVRSGIEDYDGNEIYSGDILELVSPDFGIEAESKHFIVYYLDGTFAAEGSKVILDTSFKHFRIVGNTFENRELAFEITRLIEANTKSKRNDVVGPEEET